MLPLSDPSWTSKWQIIFNLTNSFDNEASPDMSLQRRSDGSPPQKTSLSHKQNWHSLQMGWGRQTWPIFVIILHFLQTCNQLSSNSFYFAHGMFFCAGSPSRVSEVGVGCRLGWLEASHPVTRKKFSSFSCEWWDQHGGNISLWRLFFWRNNCG